MHLFLNTVLHEGLGHSFTKLILFLILYNFLTVMSMFRDNDMSLQGYRTIWTSVFFKNVLPLGDNFGLCLSESVGEVQTDPLCNSSVGENTELPFSVMPMVGEVRDI